MKKIATLTFHRSDNFGSVLQAYALGEKLFQMGYCQFIIDYRKPEVAQMYKILKKPTSKFLLITDMYNILHYGKLRKRQQRFERFRKEHLRLSKRYDDRKSLIASPPEADVFICGSDQIWNVGILDFDDTYLLDFVNNRKKASYAASGINSSCSDENVDRIKRMVSSFSKVTVRESYAADRLGIDRQNVVLDPVLLLDKKSWETLCADIYNNEKYMVCYFAGNVSFEFEKFTKEYAMQNNLKRILIMPEWRNAFRNGKKSYDSGPVEFLSLIKNAHVVCTNSFHGTAFSILFNKPFIVGQHIPFADERISTILKRFDLSDMEIDPREPKLSERLYSIDYNNVNVGIAAERDRCVDMLYEMIEGDGRV